MKNKNGGMKGKNNLLLTYVTPVDDKKLLAECDVQVFKGKHQANHQGEVSKNAVRLVHGPTGIRVSSHLGVSQSENKKAAIDKLRQEIDKLLTFHNPRKETTVSEAIKKQRMRDQKRAAEKKAERNSLET